MLSEKSETLNEREQNRKILLTALNNGFYFKCAVQFINRNHVKYDNVFFQFCLPVGKAEDTPLPTA